MGLVIFCYQDDWGCSCATGPELNPIVIGPYTKNDSIDSLVSDIRDQCDYNSDLIDCLFLVAHGNAGLMWIGSGLGIHHSTLFSRLKGRFAPGCRGIELHGCACASSTACSTFNSWGTIDLGGGAGYDFLQKLAVSARVCVKGSVDVMWGASAAYSYDDRVMFMTPTGDASVSGTGPVWF